MNKARDLLALAIESFRSGEYDAAAKFFASAVGSEDLDSFVSDITKNVPRSALTGPVPFGENTLNPSLASGSDLDDIVERVEARFRAECALLDDDESETELRASEDDDEVYEDDEEDNLLDEEDYEEDDDGVIESSSARKFKSVVGPVRLKN